MPYGNRRLLHCRHPNKSSGGESGGGSGSGGGKQEGEIPAWEACGKVVAAERQDFWEFIVSSIPIPLTLIYKS